MSIDSVADLVEALRRYRLLDAMQMEEFLVSLLPRLSDPRALAKEMLQRGWLTPYQVNRLFLGREQELVLESYLLLECLGEGPRGQVFKARHQIMKRLATVQVVAEALLDQPETVQRFYQEVQAASQLSDPHLLHAYDAGPAGRTHYVATEYVHGLDLERLVQQAGPLPVDLACDFVRQAALGLQHAAERGLLHADLQPANLIATLPPRGVGLPPTDSGEAVLASGAEAFRGAVIKIRNLGLSFSWNPRTSEKDRARAHPLDAADFLAPEMADVPALGDVRSELYSLGCVLYYLLSGQPPFPGGKPADKPRRHEFEEAVPLEMHRWDVPLEVAAVVRKLMAREPAERYQSPAEAAAVLEEVLQWRTKETPTTTPVLGAASTDTVVAASSPPPELPERVTPPPDPFADIVAGAEQRSPQKVVRDGRWLWLAGGGGVLLAGLVGLLIFLALHTAAGPAKLPVEPPSRPVPPEEPPRYVKMPTREETILATLRANGLPTLEGPWYYIGPFDNTNNQGFAKVYPPEEDIDIRKSYPGKGQSAAWKPLPKFAPGRVCDLKLFPQTDFSCVYLYHPIECRQKVELPLSLGSDDTLTVWLNKKQLLANNVARGVAPDQDFVTLPLQTGKNQLLVKVCNGMGDWAFYVLPLFPPRLDELFGETLRRDFPKPGR
jgi:serine/threonine-protein kinase